MFNWISRLWNRFSLSHAPSEASLEAGHEVKDVNALYLGLGAIGVIASAVVLHLGLTAYFQGLKHAMPETPIHDVRSAFPQREPRLTHTLPGDYAAYARHEEQLLHQYSWEDRATGRVRIPIEKAMEAMLHGK